MSTRGRSQYLENPGIPFKRFQRYDGIGNLKPTLLMSLLKVAIYQPVIPAYRVPFFEALQARDDLDIDVYAAWQVPGSPATPRQDFAFRHHAVEFRGMFGDRVSRQSGYEIPAGFSSGDVMILCGNPRYLSNYRLACQAKRQKIGIVWWGHGFSPGSRGGSLRIRQFIMKLADVWLLYTDKEAEAYRKLGFPADRVFALNNTLNTAIIQKAVERWTATELEAFREKHGLGGCRVLLYCGRVTPKAELGVALRALQGLRSKDPSYRLVVVGDGDARPGLEGLAQALGIGDAVHWVGSLYDEEELAPWFLIAALFVFPGAIGLSAIHAFSYGLPVLTHDREDLHGPEFAAIQDGRNGSLFVHGSDQSLADHIDACIKQESLLATMKINAKNTVEGRYSFTHMVDQFVRAVRAASDVVQCR